MAAEEFTEMRVYRMVLDPNTNSPVVVLQDEATGTLLPIWIGFFEAHSIAMKLEGVDSARPMTHDLLTNLVSMLDALITRVEVVDLVDNTYFARISISLNDKRHILDSRPSDAIALAIRTDSPIFVASHVLEQSKIDPSQLEERTEGGDNEEMDEDEWNRILRNFKPGGGGDKLN
jgi:bifunctional DNase/RNase